MGEFVRCCGGGWEGRGEEGDWSEERNDLNEVAVGTLGGPCVVPTLESERFESRKIRSKS